MSADEIKSIVKRFFDEPWNKGNVDIIDELCAPEYTVTYLATKWNGGREGLKDAIRNSRAASPNFHGEVDEIIVEGNRAAYQWTMTEINEQGKLVTVVGMTFLRFEKGKIVEDRFVNETISQEAPPS
jgi:ketosteroid isomerase-like protein